MHVEVSFPNSAKVQARCKDLVVETGPPPDRGGDPAALGPFDILLCSVATCTGFHVLSFLHERGLSIEEAGLEIEGTRDRDSHLLEKVSIRIRVPRGFPERYRSAIVRAARLCLVQAQLGRQPEFEMSVFSG
jgi:putative redox protein